MDPLKIDTVRLSEAGDALVIIDQTLLPNEEREIRLETAQDVYDAIKLLRVRGAPAIGICAAYGLYVTALDLPEEEEAFWKGLEELAAYLNSSRPTAVNLSWAIRSMLDTARAHRAQGRTAVLEALYARAVAIQEEDIAMCTAISRYGASLLKDGDGVLTHCNAGPLATSRYGTAQGALLMAAEGNGFEDVLTYYDHLMEHLRWKNLGHVLAGGNMDAGDIDGKPELQAAYELGRSIT